MRANRKRGKSSGRLNITKFIVPVLVLIIAGVGLWWLIHGKTPPPPPPTTLQKPVEPFAGDINATIYMDNSYSMEGYAKADHGNLYIDVLSDLRAFYPQTDARFGTMLIPGSGLISRIRQGLPYSQQSLLHKDLEHIASDVLQELTDTLQRLNFYLTDGIMSGSNQALHQDPEYNKIHAQDLQNQIKSAFEGKNRLGVSVYQFKTPFVGTYWTYNNSRTSLNGTQRYFYLIAVGSREALADFKCKADSAKINKGSKFHPLAQWHAIEDTIVNAYLTVGPSGVVKQENNADVYSYSPKVINKQHNGMISFNMDVKALTNHYVEDMNALADSCIIKVDGKVFDNIPVTWKPSGHCFSFSVPTALLSKRTKVQFAVPRIEPKWIEQSSNSDDSYMLTRPNSRTFLFDKFMQGIRSAIPGASNPIIYQREVLLVQQ